MNNFWKAAAILSGVGIYIAAVIFICLYLGGLVDDYFQRGGSPTVEDRMKASMLGERAALAIISGVSNVVFGFDEGKVVSINLFDSVNNSKPLDPELVRLASVLV